MTDAQLEACRRIEHLMREHFEAGVLVLGADTQNTEHESEIHTVFHGPVASAVGLLEIGKLVAMKKTFRTP